MYAFSSLLYSAEYSPTPTTSTVTRALATGSPSIVLTLTDILRVSFSRRGFVRSVLRLMNTAFSPSILIMEAK